MLDRHTSYKPTVNVLSQKLAFNIIDVVGRMTMSISFIIQQQEIKRMSVAVIGTK